MSSALLDFLSQQNLTRLGVHAIFQIPFAVFVRLVRAAPILSFFYVSIREDLEDASTNIIPPRDPLQCLNMESQSVCTLFGRPQFAPYTGTLRRLSFLPEEDRTGRVLFSACRTLEHVRLFSYDPVIPLPQLPALRSAEVCIPFFERTGLAFLPTLIGLLHASPQLTVLTITFVPIFVPYSPLPGVLDRALMGTLSHELAVHANSPRLCWRLDISGAGGDVFFSDFSLMVRRGMPQLLAQKRLAIEAYQQPSINRFQ
ncbi:hypothetical protein C8R44DRAFT_887107 [Mycena epipterygia]|nr:hypothetical protein C8R44DRAFT_887107 [Mycena epipterygia]